MAIWTYKAKESFKPIKSFKPIETIETPEVIKTFLAIEIINTLKSKGSSHSKKKKKCEISHVGGGVWPKLGHFHTFFLFFSFMS